MTAKTALGSCAHFCSMGTANATVLPEPVREPPIQSRPERMGGMQTDWMRVGVLMERWESEVVSQFSTPRLGKVVGLLLSVEARMDGGAAVPFVSVLVDRTVGFMRESVEASKVCGVGDSSLSDAEAPDS